LNIPLIFDLLHLGEDHLLHLKYDALGALLSHTNLKVDLLRVKEHLNCQVQGQAVHHHQKFVAHYQVIYDFFDVTQIQELATGLENSDDDLEKV
jgi:hypothetical protein